MSYSLEEVPIQKQASDSAAGGRGGILGAFSKGDDDYGRAGTASGGTEKDQELKLRCRNGLAHVERRFMWMKLAGVQANNLVFYLQPALQVFGNANPLPKKLFKVPFLGVEPQSVPEPALYLLQQPSVALSAAHDRVVSVLAQLESLTYCPMVPNLALILLHYLNEAEAFIVLENLVHCGRTKTMFFVNRADEDAFLYAFLQIVKSRVSKIYDHIMYLLQRGEDVKPIFRSWFQNFFSGWLPHEDVYRVVDMYLSEGPKILIRLGLAWLKFRKAELRETKTAYEFEMALRNWVLGNGESAERKPYRFSSLSEIGFNIRNLSKNDIDKHYAEFKRTSQTHGFKVSAEDSFSEDDIRSISSMSDRSHHMGKTVHFPKVLFHPPFFVKAELDDSGFDADPDAGDEEMRKVFDHYGFFSPARPTTDDASREYASSLDIAEVKKKTEKNYMDHYVMWDHVSAKGLQKFMNSLSRGKFKAYCVAMSRHLSSLETLLPKAVSSCDWLPLYFSGRHGWSIDELVEHTKGIAPILLFLRVSPRSQEASPSSSMVLAVFSMHGLPTPPLIKRIERFTGTSESETSAGGGTGVHRAQSSKYSGSRGHDSDILRRTHSSVSYSRLAEGNSADQVLRNLSTKTNMSHLNGGLLRAWQKSAPWVGASDDFVCQVHPDCCPVRVDGAEIPDSLEEGTTDSECILKQNKFVSINAEGHAHLLVGGQDSPKAPLVEIHGDLQEATISVRLLNQISCRQAGIMNNGKLSKDSSARLRVTGVEAYGFMDKASRVACSEEFSARKALEQVSAGEKEWEAYVQGTD
eukprot:gb/GECG01011936.1/.p1 GENE.gb/GECG01011936.1/~~gb/GECG01011936.1/.p1  ORF type:complete len:805 (+),score=102.19 gb/GECG01011936.1/:1-2415(+)